MRCVLDANVWVAALLSRNGIPARLVRMWLDGAFEVVVSPLLLAELRRVLAYPKIRTRVPKADADAVLALIGETATLHADPSPRPGARTNDPDDEYLVTLAEAARAVIVTGDRHLLSLSGSLPVRSPADFLLFAQQHEGHRGIGE